MSSIHTQTRPIIIISAARSGTKMLRKLLATIPELTAFPYDMNYIWKYGNYHIPHDELTREHLTEKTRQFIRKQFYRRLSKSHAGRILEKTVGNSLRVDFVRAIFPDCQIIHLYRHGKDVAVSARECWQASMFSSKIQSKRDLFDKIVHFPFKAAFPYGLEYLTNYAARFLSRTERVKSWGPRFKDIDDVVKQYPLLGVCGIQWGKSIEASLRSFSRLEENKHYMNVCYEDLVQEPIKELKRIVDYLEIKEWESAKMYAEQYITDRYIGNWKKVLSSEEDVQLSHHIDTYLDLLGYDR